MKLSNLFFCAMAALAFAACSNAEDEDASIKGTASVKVNIITPGTRGVEVATPDGKVEGSEDKVPVDIKTVRLVLTATAGSSDVTFTTTDEKSAVVQANEYTFTGVNNPTRMQVYINGGEDLDATLLRGEMELEKFVDAGLAEPMYGESQTFTKQASVTGQPDVYKTSITPAHRMARLEFSGIQHADADGECLFKEITFDGLYLSNVQKTEGDADSYTDNPAVPTVIGDVDSYLVNSVGESFLGEQGNPIFPANDGETAQCYAYNVFPSAKTEGVGNDKMPKLVLSFSNLKPIQAGATLSTPQYARVSKYVGDKQVEITSFEVGKIYRITSLKVADANISPAPGTTVNVIAEVKVTDWTLIDAGVVWQ